MHCWLLIQQRQQQAMKNTLMAQCSEFIHQDKHRRVKEMKLVVKLMSKRNSMRLDSLMANLRNDNNLILILNTYF